MGAEQSTPAAAGADQPEQNNQNGQTATPEAHPAGVPSALVIVGPSGVGKGTLINKLVEGSDKFGFSVSHTTRSPRPGEKVGQCRCRAC